MAAATYQKSQKTKSEDGLAEAGAEVLPEGGVLAGVARGEKKSEHEDEAADAGGANEDAQDEGDADGELAVSDEEGDGSGVREDEAAEGGDHEGIGAAIEKAVDAILKAAVKSELGAEDFVFAEDEEEDADGDAKESEGAGVLGVGGRYAGHSVVETEKERV